MKVKSQKFSSPMINRFDLLGNDETGLSKAFAYLLASDRTIFFRFLRELGVRVNNTETNFKDVVIEIERKRQEGRTDIEIRHTGKFHIIIECKVAINRIDSQRYKYRPCFADEPQKVLCFITQERDCNYEVSDAIDIHYMGWLDIIGLIKPGEERNDIISEFASYSTRGFKMRDQKEVLIQDMSKPEEIRLYKENFIYRRNKTFGCPLYFAPYFTKAANETEGIIYLSKVLGVITALPQDVLNFEDELRGYAGEDESLFRRWITGLKGQNAEDKVTHYFLAEPVHLNKPLLKDGGREKGRGKGWIAALIPKNRCVTFEEFTRRVVLATTDT